MAPTLDNELLLKIQRLTEVNPSLHLGFRVKFPEGMTVGFMGAVAPGYEAMDREAAEDLIAKEVAKLGISDENFTLLPIAAMFVK